MSGLQPDLSEARRLLGAGMKLVKLERFTKKPEGLEWNKHPVRSIDAEATGYGVILEPNKLCSLDPDHYDAAIVGMRAVGFDLVALMREGVQTRSTRPGSGGRSTFAADGDIGWLTFACEKYGTVLELRADSPNLQDCVPGIVYRDKAGNLCTQQYANGRRLDDAPPLPDGLFHWWQRCSMDIDFLREQQGRFFEGIAQHFGDTLDSVRPNRSISTGKGGSVLAFAAPGHRGPYNRAHTVESHLERHGYTYHRDLDRWSCPSASGAPGIRRIPDKVDLWRSDHASDPLHGTFDAWSAHVVLDHGGDLDGAIRAAQPAPPDDDRFPPIDVLAQEDERDREAGDPGADLDSGSRETGDRENESRDGLSLVAFDLDELMGPIAPERELLPGVPCEAYTLIAGGLATAKTTLLHSMLLSRATGYDFLNLAPTGVGPGPCVLVSYEDADRRIVRRFQILVQYQHQLVAHKHGPEAASKYLAAVACNVRRVTLTGKAGTGIVCRSPGGVVLPNKALLNELVGRVKKFASSDVLIGLDPLRLAIVGSQSDDDGADVVVHVLNDLASRLPDSGLVVPSHTTKAQAQEVGGSRAQAAYATAGSALYSQHARSNFSMTRLSTKEALETFGVDEVTVEEAEQERVVKLTHARLSHGPESKARYYVMRGGVLVPVRPNSQELPLAEQARRALPAMDEAIRKTTQLGHRASKKALEEFIGIARTREERRKLVAEAIAQGWLLESGSTSDKLIEMTPAGREQLSPRPTAKEAA